MKHKNIAVFVPHAGCPYQCAFCDQHTITAQDSLPRPEDVRRICMQAMQEIRDRSSAQIAFFGGSFTAMPQDYMRSLLAAAQPFLGEDGFAGIRISTRPDCIGREMLTLLKSCRVTAIELGAQSMDDAVLAANDRGHTAQDVRDAAALIRQYGFELGLQIMPGLYGAAPGSDRETAQAVCALHPDTVRIYPVVILRGTRLAQLYASGAYVPYPFDDMVELVASQMLAFQESGIRIIKVGLHASELVEADAVGGYYHPAFRELCESRIFRTRMEEELADSGTLGDRTLLVHPSCVSKAIGQNKANLRYFDEVYGIRLHILPDASAAPFTCRPAGSSTR